MSGTGLQSCPASEMHPRWASASYLSQASGSECNDHWPALEFPAAYRQVGCDHDACELRRFEGIENKGFCEKGGKAETLGGKEVLGENGLSSRPMVIDPTLGGEAGEGNGLPGERRRSPARFLGPASAVYLKVMRVSGFYYSLDDVDMVVRFFPI